MKKRSALIFGLLAALLALGMAVTGCSNGSTDDGGGGAAEFPAAWGGTGGYAQTWGATGNPQVKTWNVASGSFLYYYTSGSSSPTTTYRLKSFTGDGTSTGTFKVKKLEGSEETGEELTVTYSYNSVASTLTLVSTDITEFGTDPGETFTKQ